MVLLDEVTASPSPVGRALALSAKAATVGFDWPDADSVFEKVNEELDELRASLSAGGEGSAEELGDLLFAVINLARKLDIDPSAALEKTNQKFISRFGHIERRMHGDGKTWDEASLTELEALWNEAKVLERASALDEGSDER